MEHKRLILLSFNLKNKKDNKNIYFLIDNDSSSSDITR